MSPYSSYIILGSNLVTQLFCVSGVNRLTSVSAMILSALAIADCIYWLASILGVDQSRPYDAKSAQSLLQCLVLWERLEYPALPRCWDGLFRQLSVFTDTRLAGY
jgi:hypothetical protein